MSKKFSGVIETIEMGVPHTNDIGFYIVDLTTSPPPQPPWVTNSDTTILPRPRY